MSISVGELFVDLGIKGSEKTLGAISATQKGLGEAGHTALETKVAILGAVYAFERLMEASGQAGTGMTNFNAITGVSAQTLQQYQYAARQMGVANDDVANSFKGLQSAMTKTLMGEGAPKGLGRVAALTGGITAQDVDQFARNPEMLMKRLSQYAQQEKNVGLRNEVLKSFGLGDPMIAAMARGGFRPETMSHAPTYSNAEIGALDRANIAWSNLGTKIEMAIGHFNARHGGQLVKDLSMITDSVIKLANALQMTAEKFKLFETLGHGIEGIANTLKLVSEVWDKLNGGPESKKGDILYNTPGKSAFPIDQSSLLGKLLAPRVSSSGGGQTNVTVNQDLHFQHDGKDSKRTGDSTKKAVQDAFRQYTAQGQGS